MLETNTYFMTFHVSILFLVIYFPTLPTTKVRADAKWASGFIQFCSTATSCAVLPAVSRSRQLLTCRDEVEVIHHVSVKYLRTFIQLEVQLNCEITKFWKKILFQIQLCRMNNRIQQSSAWDSITQQKFQGENSEYCKKHSFYLGKLYKCLIQNHRLWTKLQHEMSKILVHCSCHGYNQLWVFSYRFQQVVATKHYNILWTKRI